MPLQWICISKWRFRGVAPQAMKLLHWMEVNVFDVVSHPCIDDSTTFPHLTICPKNQHCSFETLLDRTKNMLKDHPCTFLIMDLLFIHSSCFSMSFRVIFRRIWKKGIKDASKIWRLWSNCGVDVSWTRIYCAFLLIAPIVRKRCPRSIWSVLRNNEIIIAPSGHHCYWTSQNHRHYDKIQLTNLFISPPLTWLLLRADVSLSFINSSVGAYDICSPNVGCCMKNWKHSTAMQYQKHV